MGNNSIISKPPSFDKKKTTIRIANNNKKRYKITLLCIPFMNYTTGDNKVDIGPPNKE